MDYGRYMVILVCVSCAADVHPYYYYYLGYLRAFLGVINEHELASILLG